MACAERRGFGAPERRSNEEAEVDQPCCSSPQKSGHVVRKSTGLSLGTQKRDDSLDSVVTAVRGSTAERARTPATGSSPVPALPGPKPSEQANGQGPLGQASSAFMRAPSCMNAEANLEERSECGVGRKTSVRRPTGPGVNKNRARLQQVTRAVV